jgi:hypothetical protein
MIQLLQLYKAGGVTGRCGGKAEIMPQVSFFLKIVITGRKALLDGSVIRRNSSC